MNLSKSLCTKGLILTPCEPFEASTKQEIEGLLNSGVFEFTSFDKSMIGKRIFNMRIVNSIKEKTTLTPYEKSRLVVQAYNDRGKSMVLTQSPTVQRAIVQLILTLGLSFIKIYDHIMFLRDISQAYTQSKTLLTRDILCHPAPEVIKSLNLDPNTVMRILKPLYRIPEAGNHWFQTYSRHLKEKLGMAPSFFDPSLFIIIGKPFGINGMQVDDTLFVGIKDFVKLEEAKLKERNLKAKDIDRLAINKPLQFNGLMICLQDDSIFVKPNSQGSKIKLVDPEDRDL